MRLRITDLQAPPTMAAMARLAAADRQLATLEADGRGSELILTVTLPTTEQVPAPALDTAETAIGVDWSPATLGAVAAVTTGESGEPGGFGESGLVSDHRDRTYQDRGLGVTRAAADRGPASSRDI